MMMETQSGNKHRSKRWFKRTTALLCCGWLLLAPQLAAASSTATATQPSAVEKSISLWHYAAPLGIAALALMLIALSGYVLLGRNQPIG